MHSKTVKILSLFFVLFLMVFIAGVISLSVGASDVTLSDILQMLQGEQISPAARSIICQIRFPRIVVGFAVGSALALA